MLGNDTRRISQNERFYQRDFKNCVFLSFFRPSLANWDTIIKQALRRFVG